MTDLSSLAQAVARAILPNTDPEEFHPHEDWHDLGMLVEVLETQGLYLMVNSATKAGAVRRIASFHRDTGWGYPCIGSSEWGYFAKLGEAVLRAAHEALLKPRA